MRNQSLVMVLLALAQWTAAFNVHWQKVERERLLELINQNNLSIDELEEKIRKDPEHLYDLSYQNQVCVEEIKEWIKKEIKKLQQEGLIETEKLKDWQTDWRGNLTNMVKERDFTVEEFHKWLLEDRTRLQALAMQHNVQIEEIEQWVHNEEHRFVSMGLLKPNEKLTNWQKFLRRYLKGITQEQYKSTEQLERRLRLDRQLLENLSRDFSIQVEEIEKWMKKELVRLRDDGQLQIDNLASWQIAERERLEKLTQQNKQWSAEELERVLHQDREHMQKMAFRYHITVVEIVTWYKQELQRIYGNFSQQVLTVQQLEEMLLNDQKKLVQLEEMLLKVQKKLDLLEEISLKDQKKLDQLADKYQDAIEEIEQWKLDELNRLANFGLVNTQTAGYNSWQQQERDRLRTIAAEITISDEELLEFLKTDNSSQDKLAKIYGCPLDQLVPFQRGEVNYMQLKGFLDNTALLHEEPRQKYERDQLYSFIKNQTLSQQKLSPWQRQEYVRLHQLGKIYKMDLSQLQDFRENQLLYMVNVMHMKTSNEQERLDFRIKEHNLMDSLKTTTHLTDEELLVWRRRLYLLCQGRVPIDVGGYGGYETGIGSTKGTATPQPPNVEDFGKQQQVVLGDNKQHENDQQQQVQVDLRRTTFMTSHHGASQKQVEGTAATPSNQQIEVTAETEPSGLWNKLKKKTGNTFG